MLGQICSGRNSGTSALHIAIKVAGILPDDEVMVPSLTFASTVNTIIYNGARPIFLIVINF